MMRYIFLFLFTILIQLLYSAPVGSSFPITTQSGDQQNPSVVYLPNYRLYFVVWEDWRDVTDSDIYGAFFDENGNICGSEFIIGGSNTDNNIQTSPDVAYAPDLNKLLVVWSDNTPNYVKYREIDLTTFNATNCSGYTLGTTGNISFNPLAGESLTDRNKPKVAYDIKNHKFVVVWSEVRDQDKVIQGTCSLNSKPFSLSVDDNTFVGYAIIDANTLNIDEADIIRETTGSSHARLITHSVGALQETFEYEIFNNVDNVDVDCSPTGECLIVFESDRNRVNVQCICTDTNNNGTCDTGETVVLSLSTDNFQGDDDSKHIFATTLTQFKTTTGLLPKVDTSPQQSTNPVVKADPVSGKFLVVWEDRRDNVQKPKIYGQLITQNGNLYGDNFVISYKDSDNDGNNDLLNVQTSNPAIGYDGANNVFFVVWEDERDSTSQQNLNIYGQYVTTEGALQGENYQITTDTNNQKFPKIAYNPNQLRFLVVWKDFRNSQTSGSDVYGRFFDSIVNQNILILKEDKQTVLYPLILDFGAVAVNNSDVRTIYIKNNGQTVVNLDCITLSGTGFSIDNPIPSQLNNCNDNNVYQLAEGEMLELRIRFSPSTEQSYEGFIEIKDNLGNVLRKIKVKGQGINNPIPALEVTESDGTNDGVLDFGDVKTGTTAARTIIIRNTGNVTVNLSVTSSSSEFLLRFPNQHNLPNQSLTLTLNPGEQQSVVVVFDATNLKGGDYTAKLYIADTSTSTTIKTINLKASVVVPAGLSVTDINGNPVSTLDFGSVKLGNTAQRVVVIENTSNVELTVQVTSSDSKYQIVIPKRGREVFYTFKLQPGEREQVRIEFDSTGLTRGDYPAKLYISTKAGDVNIAIDLQATVTAPILRIDTDTLDFGKVDVGTSKTLSVKVYNDGDAILNISSCGTPPEGFSITSCPTSVAPSSYEELKITFQPSEPKQYSGILTIETDAGAKDIKLIGKGKGAKIEVSSNFLDFGQVVIGSSKKLVLEISNTGSDDLVINSIDITSLPPEFNLSAINYPINIFPGTSFSLTIDFTPALEQVYRGYFTINSNAFNNPNLNVYLQGIGVALNVSVEPTVIDFGEVNVGDEKVQGVLITNTSSEEIQIVDIAQPSENFEANIPALPYTLKPGQSLNIPVKFKPQSEGTFASTLSILFNFSTNPYIVTLQGKANAKVVSTLQFFQDGVPITILNFGNVPVNKVKTATLTIKNLQFVDINLINIYTNPPFDVLQTTVKIPANSTTDIDVTFAPTRVGNYTGILKMVDSNGNTYEITLMGNATSGEVRALEGKVNFTEKKVVLPNAISSLSFSVTDIPPNTDTVDVQITFSTPLPENAKVYKYISVNNYKEIYPKNTCNGISDVKLSGNTLTFKIKDNSECDLDPTVGKILDPIVVTKGEITTTTTTPTQTLPSLKGGGGGGGCSSNGNNDYSFLLTITTLLFLFIKRRLSFLL